MRRVKTIDEIYSEVSDCSLVVTNDIALMTALNARVDRPIVGSFAVTPQHIARMLSSEILGKQVMSDIAQVTAISDETGLDFRIVHGELMNIREIRRYTSDVRKYLSTASARKVYDSFESLPTLERAMSSFDASASSYFLHQPGEVAVVGVDLFDDLDKHFVPLDYRDVEIFSYGEEYSIEEIHEVGNDRQIAENVADLITDDNAEDCAIVLDASGQIADSVRSALYAKGIPFYNRLDVRDLAQIRDYLQFAALALSYDTLRVKNVKELFSNYNGFFVKGVEGFLLGRLEPSDMRSRGQELRDLMRNIRGMTFGELRDSLCDRRARIQVGIVIVDLGIRDENVTSELVSKLAYAVENVSDLHHNEEVPIEEKSGVLIADCKNSVFVDRPLVFFIGMDHSWDVQIAGKRYIDSEDETDRNVMRLSALLQQGERRIYIVNATKNGKPARPAMTLDEVLGKPAARFREVCGNVVSGRWFVPSPEVRPERGEERMDAAGRIVGKFSKTAFNSYFFCPRKYFFYKIMPMPEEKNSEFGALVHEFAQLYMCYPDVVEEVGFENLIDIVSDRYAGLSTPLMRGLDHDRIACAMRNVARYIDSRIDEDVPLDRPSDREHGNRFFDRYGLEYWSSASEVGTSSFKHPMFGKFDAVSDGLVLDYKTGKAHTGREVCEAMSADKPSRFPEFQPILYTLLSKEAGGKGEMELFYALANDTESLEDGYDVRRSVVSVRILEENLSDAIVGNETLRRNLEFTLSIKFKENIDAVLDAISKSWMGTPPSRWKEDEKIMAAVLQAVGLKDGKTNRKDAGAAIGKIAKELRNLMVCSEDAVEISQEACNEFHDMLDRMHDEAVEYACTSFPAEPKGNCKDCAYFPFCTAEIVSVDESQEEGEA